MPANIKNDSLSLSLSYLLVIIKEDILYPLGEGAVISKEPH